MRLKGFYIGRAQRVAAALLLLMLGECLWRVEQQPLTTSDFRYARCGREMWEQPSAIAGYFTTCGNMNGDGTFAYRLAGLPLTLERWTLRAADRFRKPEDRLFGDRAQGDAQHNTLGGSMWETRHELSYDKWLLRLPFVLFALWLGGGVWWVARRLFGNEGGALALALYALSPAVLRAATAPNNDVLAMWGLYGLTYTAIGVAHAMQGPRRKWRPRIVLLSVSLGMTAAAHTLAAIVGFVAGAAFLFYLAERRRSDVAQILVFTATGAVALLFVFFGFHAAAFLYVFTGGSARFGLSLDGLRRLAGETVAAGWMHGALLPVHGGIVLAAGIALAAYTLARRSRYFGNTTPLLMTLALMFLYTTQVQSAPWIWALPFLLTFVAGVFADMLEGRRRRLALMTTYALVLGQAALCWTWLAAPSV